MKSWFNWLIAAVGVALGIDIKWYAHQPWWLLGLMVAYGGALAFAGYRRGRKAGS